VVFIDIKNKISIGLIVIAVMAITVLVYWFVGGIPNTGRTHGYYHKQQHEENQQR